MFVISRNKQLNLLFNIIGIMVTMNVILSNKFVKFYIGRFIFKQFIKLHEKQIDNTDSSKPKPLSSNKFIRSLCFNEERLNMLPHTKIGTIITFSKLRQVMLLQIIGNYFPNSSLQIMDEDKYNDDMLNMKFTVMKHSKEGDELYWFEQFLDIIGRQIIEWDELESHYCISTKGLSKHEIKPGYAKLDTQMIFEKKGPLNKMILVNIVINGETRNIDDGFAIRHCMTAIFTKLSIKQHLIGTHMMMASGINCIIESKLTNDHPIRRLLGMYSISPYFANEVSTVSLLGKTGLSLNFGFTHRGLFDYISISKEMFNIRKEFYRPSQNTADNIYLDMFAASQ